MFHHMFITCLMTLSERFERSIYLMEKQHIKAVYSEGINRL